MLFSVVDHFTFFWERRLLQREALRIIRLDDDDARLYVTRKKERERTENGRHPRNELHLNNSHNMGTTSTSRCSSMVGNRHGFVQAREDYGVNIILAPTFATDWLATRMEEEVPAHELVSGKRSESARTCHGIHRRKMRHAKKNLRLG